MLPDDIQKDIEFWADHAEHGDDVGAWPLLFLAVLLAPFVALWLLLR